VRLGDLVGEVGDGGEVLRLAALVRRGERDVAEQLEVRRRAARGRDVGAPVPRAVGVPGDVAGLAEVLALGLHFQAGGEELPREPLRPAAVGQALLRGLGGEAADEAVGGRHASKL
jgi:hypothetical protein